MPGLAIITEACIDVKDRACVDVCPVQCIYEFDPQNNVLFSEVEAGSGITETTHAEPAGCSLSTREGTRSLDGDLHAGHTGAAYLSMATDAPIVPTGIVGTSRIQPPGARFPRPFRPVTVRFGTPIDPTIYTGSRRHRRRLITDDVMTAIQTLSGQNHTARPGSHAADCSRSIGVGRR